jgi:hypothetical protein
MALGSAVGAAVLLLLKMEPDQPGVEPKDRRTREAVFKPTIGKAMLCFMVSFATAARRHDR